MLQVTIVRETFKLKYYIMILYVWGGKKVCLGKDWFVE